MESIVRRNGPANGWPCFLRDSNTCDYLPRLAKMEGTYVRQARVSEYRDLPVHVLDLEEAMF